MAQHNPIVGSLQAGSFDEPQGQQPGSSLRGLRERALAAWLCANPPTKVAAVRALAADCGSPTSAPQWPGASGALGSVDCPAPAPVQPGRPAPLQPGRPALPKLVSAGQVPNRPANTAEGRVALMHAIAHIEFNAIDLALDAIWRFDAMPVAYYEDWLRVADEEAQHYALVAQWLAQQGAAYGDCDAHDGLWQMAARTAHDHLARMALVPAVLEARGLDATPVIQQRLRSTAGDLRNAGDRAAVAALDAALRILERILDDEIGHVRIGWHWYRWLCERHRVEPEAHFLVLMEQYGAPWPKPPVNLGARRAAGFSPALLDRFGEPRKRVKLMSK